MGYILSSYYKLQTSGPQFYTRVWDLELVLNYQIPKTIILVTYLTF